jgi:PPOX class probable F420-dependent enzyme
VSNRRAQIRLDPAEQLVLLEAERIVVVSSWGPRGWPHSMPLWYVPRAGEVWIYTYARSQKVINLERDPRATLLLETGHEYGELRGIEIQAEAEINRETEAVYELARELAIRYSGGSAAIDEEAAESLRAQAAKRVAVRFEAKRTASWDHRKLGSAH